MPIDIGPTPLKVAVKVDTDEKVAGALILLFKEVVESRVSIGVPNGAIVNVKPNHYIGHLKFSLLHCANRYQGVSPIH